MGTLIEPVGSLTAAQVTSVLAVAGPTVDHSFSLRCTRTAIEIHRVAGEYDLPALLAAGAALLNLRVAIRAVGVDSTVRLLPNRTEPNHLADIYPRGSHPNSAHDQALAAELIAITARRGLPESWQPTPVPEGVCNQLRQAAKLERAWLATLSRLQLLMLRTLTTGADATLAPTPLTAVIGTVQDSPTARIQSGQAAQRVLLTAGLSNVAVSFSTEVVADPAAREHLRELIGGGLWPQAVLRLGYPLSDSADRPLSGTPIGSVDDPLANPLLASSE